MNRKTTVALIGALLLALAAAAFGQPSVSDAGRILMGATISTERDTLTDTVTIPDLAGYVGYGAPASGLVPAGFFAQSEAPFGVKVYDDYVTSATPDTTSADSAGVFTHLPADPYTLTGPAWPCKLTYLGSPNIAQFYFAAGDTAGHGNKVELTPFYVVPEGP